MKDTHIPARSKFSHRTAARMILPLVLVAGLVSCSSGERVRLHPVGGKVLYKDKALAKAMVVFHPLGDYPDDLPKPLAYTDAEGQFKMTTRRPGDGVPTGEYALTVEWRERTRTGAEKIGGRNLLPPRYSKPESSGLRCRVQEGPNELAPLLLTEK
jgi:hypothetical protein